MAFFSLIIICLFSTDLFLLISKRNAKPFFPDLNKQWFPPKLLVESYYILSFYRVLSQLENRFEKFVCFLTHFRWLQNPHATFVSHSEPRNDFFSFRIINCLWVPHPPKTAPEVLKGSPPGEFRGWCCDGNECAKKTRRWDISNLPKSWHCLVLVVVKPKGTEKDFFPLRICLIKNFNIWKSPKCRGGGAVELIHFQGYEFWNGAKI